MALVIGIWFFIYKDITDIDSVSEYSLFTESACSLCYLTGLLYVEAFAMLYFTDGLAYGHSETERKSVREKISKVFRTTEYSHHIVKLEQVILLSGF